MTRNPRAKVETTTKHPGDYVLDAGIVTTNGHREPTDHERRGIIPTKQENTK